MSERKEFTYRTINKSNRVEKNIEGTLQMSETDRPKPIFNTYHIHMVTMATGLIFNWFLMLVDIPLPLSYL